MKPEDYFILHPIAFEHVQEVLLAEARMIQSGMSVEARVQFLQSETERLSNLAKAFQSEILQPLFAGLNKQDYAHDFAEIQARFEANGFRGTLRQIRNQQRRFGMKYVSVDGTIVRGGLALLQHDAVVTRAVERLLVPRLESLLIDEEFMATEKEYNAIMNEKELHSVRDAKAVDLATNAFSVYFNANPKFADLNAQDIRDVAFIYGKVLDLHFTDIALALIGQGELSVVKKWLSDGVEVSTDFYRNVVRQMLLERISAIQPTSAPSPENSKKSAEPTVLSKPDAAESHGKTDPEEFLTVQQVMVLLQVSRSTVDRLTNEGLIIKIKVGRLSRFSRNSIIRYLGK